MLDWQLFYQHVCLFCFTKKKHLQYKYVTFFVRGVKKISAAPVKKEFTSNKFSVGIAFILFHRDPSSYWYGWVPSPGWHHNPIYTGICAQIVLNQCSATCLHCWVSKYIKVYFHICSSPYSKKKFRFLSCKILKTRVLWNVNAKHSRSVVYYILKLYF